MSSVLHDRLNNQPTTLDSWKSDQTIWSDAARLGGISMLELSFRGDQADLALSKVGDKSMDEGSMPGRNSYAVKMSPFLSLVGSLVQETTIAHGSSALDKSDVNGGLSVQRVLLKCDLQSIATLGYHLCGALADRLDDLVDITFELDAKILTGSTCNFGGRRRYRGDWLLCIKGKKGI